MIREILATVSTSLLIASSVLAEGAFPEFINPHSDSDLSHFGTKVVPLSNGNVVITAPGDDFGANNAGAVHLFNGANGKLISTITGSHVNDKVGSGGVLALPNGNFVILSPDWGTGTHTWVGAATWVDGSKGLSGVVSAANSLVGNQENDHVGSEGARIVGGGNYVVMSRDVQGVSGGEGAATWCSGLSGLSGYVSAANSLVGARTDETVGGYSNGLLTLPNGNYLIFTSSSVGSAVTWANGNTGIRGTVSSANSLVGSGWSSAVPSSAEGVTVLPNGNYVVFSPNWDSGTLTDAGAVTWGSAEYGVSGNVSSSNSLVGSSAGSIGSYGITPLANGHYLVRNLLGITWCNGLTGRTGELAADHTLLGYGYSYTLTPLPSGNFLIVDSYAAIGTQSSLGAVTWIDGSHESAGTFNPADSFMGSWAGDRVGSKVLVLANGNYVILGGGTVTASSTWANGTTGIRGVVSDQNSLICSAYPATHNAFALTDGSYVVTTTGYRSEAGETHLGAATWCDGTTGRTGRVNSSNSLIGKPSDEIGKAGVIPLANGNYVVLSNRWRNAGGIQVGAATWCRGGGVTSGVVNANNSLVGSSAGDSDTMTGVALPNGSYLVVRPKCDNGAIQDTGAVTWCPGDATYSAVVGESNSLIGSDRQSLGANPTFETPSPIQVLSDGDYVVRGPTWAGTGMRQRGSLTWGCGNGGVSGVISPENSIVGPSDDVKLGTYPVLPLPGGAFLGRGLFPCNCLVWGDGSGGVRGIPTPDNCLMAPPEPRTGVEPVIDLVNRSYYGVFIDEADNGKVKVGSFDSGGRSIPVMSIELMPAAPLPGAATAIDFGVIPSSQKSTRTIRISNKGNWPLEFGTVATPSGGFLPFSTDLSKLKSSLISGQSTAVTLTFAPTAIGTYLSMITFPSSDRKSPDFSIELRGSCGVPPAGAVYQASGWNSGALVIPVWRLLGGQPQGQLNTLSVATNTSLGGTAILEGENVVYTPATAPGTDSFILNIRTDSGFLAPVKVTVTRTDPAIPATVSGSFVTKYGTTRTGVQLMTLPNRRGAVEVSENLISWRRLGTFDSDNEGKVRFIDDESPTLSGFYRFSRP